MSEASRTPTFAEVIRLAMETRIAEIHVALPGRVESYDASQQKANIQPMIKKILKASNGEEVMRLPVLNDVPIIFPRTSEFFISLPIKKGDFVMLVFNERSIEKWMDNNGSEVNPTDLRTHHLSDAVAFPGFFPFGKSLSDVHSDNLVMGKDGGKQIHIKANEVALGAETPTDFVALASKVSAELASIASALATHVHSGVTPGPSLTGPAAPVYVPAAVASTVVRSE